jgi:hypothetical protein
MMEKRQHGPAIKRRTSVVDLNVLKLSMASEFRNFKSKTTLEFNKLIVWP